MTAQPTGDDVPGGRPHELTKAVADALVKATEAGSPRKVAAAAAGIGASTFYRYMAENEELRERVKNADGRFVQSCMKDIKRIGGKGQWQALAWLLERRFPGLFALDRKELAAMRKELAAMAERLAKLGGGPPPEAT